MKVPLKKWALSGEMDGMYSSLNTWLLNKNPASGAVSAFSSEAEALENIGAREGCDGLRLRDSNMHTLCVYIYIYIYIKMLKLRGRLDSGH